MSFNAAALKLMADKGLSAHDVAEIAAANERRADATAAERKRRQRAKGDVSRVTSRCDPPNDNSLTPGSEAKASSPFRAPEGVCPKIWADFLANRKRKRLPNTETAWALFQSELAKVSAITGIPPPELIEQCTARGWGAIYDPRGNRNDRQQQGSRNRQALLRAVGDRPDEPF